MKKLEIYVTETLRHKVVIELDDEALKNMIDDLEGDNGDDHAGDLTDSRRTLEDGEYELEYYNVVDS
jgi:hypothetical protein